MEFGSFDLRQPRRCHPGSPPPWPWQVPYGHACGGRLRPCPLPLPCLCRLPQALQVAHPLRLCHSHHLGVALPLRPRLPRRRHRLPRRGRIGVLIGAGTGAAGGGAGAGGAGGAATAELGHAPLGRHPLLGHPLLGYALLGHPLLGYHAWLCPGTLR
eukprot:scaffold2443_cov67-Phaeocystis_antarctica.AAC.1